ncbi:HicB family protein [Candidatus Pacearchaeota archaeon]|nr:HicB family protein [Candidatus Pacearchaeota archaeon]|tara:strand:+ start:476 stop:721 length:246 start_codon:yes stop_codon:yes gene_type:complete
MKSFTAVIRKGESQFVAMCPEVDVVSQGYTIEAALSNLKEAVALYIEEMGVPENFVENDTIIINFEVNDDKTAEIVRQGSH